MRNLSKIALRNLRRYTRRSLLTISLIAFGVMFVLIFAAVTASFKRLIITQITDSYMGSLQIHRRSYVASIDTLPVNLNLTAAQVTAIEAALAGIPEIHASSQRIKFGGLFSNFVETTNIRLNGVDPATEFATCPALVARILQGDQEAQTLQRGTILVPELLARGVWDQGRGYRGGGGDQQGWLGQRQNPGGERHPGKRHRAWRARWLYPHR